MRIMSGEEYCERCIHKTVCHTVAECLNSWQDDFSCNDFEPERPTGEWKITEAYPHKVYCDKCYKTYAQENWEVWKDGSLPRDFCPNCGAQMKGENE